MRAVNDPGARLLAVALLAGGAAGCFPYRQAYRSALEGVVVDPAQHPVPGAAVVTCSSDGWETDAGCPRRAEVETDVAGRFDIPALREWTWCCFGEAPRPKTTIGVCARDQAGQRLEAPPAVVNGGAPGGLRIVLVPVGPADRPGGCKTR